MLGQEGQRQARRLALLDQPLGVQLAHLLFGDDDPLDRVLARRPWRCRRASRAAAARFAGRSSLGGEVADQRQPRLGVGGDPARDQVGRLRRGRPRPRSRPPVSRCQRKRSDAAQRRSWRRGCRRRRAIALCGESGPTGLSASRPSSSERAEGAGRDQRGQLVEGAVADPAVVVVVEAVELDDEDPGRAEEDRPEERRDVGRRGRRGDRRRAARSAPPSRRRRAAAAAARRGGASRIGPALVAEPRPLGRRRAAPGSASGAPSAGSSGSASSASVPPFLQALFQRVQPPRLLPGRPAPPLRSPASCSTRARR